ncbi:MAG: non-heme haloperoxidase [uncultured Paraburkholderia sp.]|uniref:alpha/beta fold hydrolase n=1 Tax=Paraburkholderia atlantica TaxID=2654982 RepID=UPI001613FD1F|nr:alpha/beta hydrolase [Paraburkholderia atlantica]MBB5510464.1 pimeloyl-ACP methyl ester carboxylesterase [Paraburkholderia atlantica]CAH2904054.1 MAG: non-heme haloperoxidase [uncultured Paraburkholderia sp.]CAH2942221.1 MAG: non-heme haloperoxidase [uncultured Paraburkholderia sp.]
MPTITTPDGVKIFYKDWGSGQPIIFSHGWPLSADDWDAQMMFFLLHGYRVIAHDRRGHGRSEQVGTGNDMDHWVADLAALTEHLDVRDAIHIGHSTGGGEVARYVSRHQERVAKAVLVASLTPNMVKSDANPAGQPREWFDAVKSGMLGNRSEFYRAVPEGPFYGFNRPGAKPSEAVIANWWRQGMAGSAQAHYETVASWLEDYTEDLKTITVPVLVMHGEDDQIVPFASAVPRAVDLLAKGALKTYPGFPHGMLTTHADVLNPDLLEFIKS